MKTVQKLILLISLYSSQVVALGGRDECDEKEIGEGVSGWVGSHLHVWAVRTFFVIRRKFSCFFCLQLVSLKSAETSLREGFK